MDNSFITTEVNKIIKNEHWSFPLNVAMASAWILANFKGTNLKILNVSKVSSIADYFVLATASNPILASSMAQEIGKQLKKHEVNVISKEGLQDTDWILIDTGDIIVHIFQESSRDLYGLDDLWKNAAQEKIPQEFYFPAPEGTIPTTPTETPEGDYF